ncbi:MAG TPA: hypothetical protein GX744_01845 [Firmicutes bacterium]|nr:hypothetical protein [Bacillota bacterium]
MLLILWLVAVVWLSVALRASLPGKRAYRWALFCYLFFFLKEIIRINYAIADFSRVSRYPYGVILSRLVLPHGLVEFTALALGAFFALGWLKRSLRGGRLFPGSRAILLPASLILLAAAIEALVTPYLFEIYCAG